MEGYFPPEDKDKWIDAIIQLTNIYKLVHFDIYYTKLDKFH